VSFITKAQLLNNSVTFQELKFKDYRNLLKCFLGDEINSELIFTNINSILRNTCTLTNDEILNLNFIDYLILILNIRSVSLGNIVQLYAESTTNQQLRIDLNLVNIINILIQSFFIPDLTSIDYNDIEITLKIPTITDILEFENNKLTINTFFINSIKIKKQDINYQQLTYTDKDKVVKSLPIKLILKIDTQIESFLQKLNNINLLENLSNKDFDKELPLGFNSQILAFIIKLIFNNDLNSIYSNLFALSKGANFNCEFLDSCSPGEFYIFVKKFEEILQTQQTSNNETDILPPINSEADFSVE
jgi:hypothetical protein